MDINCIAPVGLEPESRSMAGTTVIFGDGAEVLSVCTPSDFEYVYFSNLPAHKYRSAEDFTALFKDYAFAPRVIGFLPEAESPRPDFLASSAIVKAEHGFFSQLRRKPGSTIDIDGATIRAYKIDSPTDTTIDCNGVFCSWPIPYTEAVLEYSAASHATNHDLWAEELHILQSLDKFHGRQLLFQDIGSHTVFVRNLPAKTSQDEFMAFLPPAVRPHKMTLRGKGGDLPERESFKKLCEILKNAGPIVGFRRRLENSDCVADAVAIYEDAESAERAVSLFQKPDSFYRVSGLVALKIPVLRVVFKYIERQVKHLGIKWNSDDIPVYVMPYMWLPSDYMLVELRASTTETLARVRAEMEKIIEGHVLEFAGGRINHPSLFLDTASPLFRAINTIDGIMVVRDRSEMALRFYGDEQKLQDIRHTLYAEQQSIVQKSTSERILQEMTMSISAEVCPVCMSSPEAPWKTSCGHVYCSNCLISQCNSGDFPIVCLGNLATCERPFSLTELSAILSPRDLEKRLDKAFRSYIRSHAKELWFCVTVDCELVHRIWPAEAPRSLHCTGCLELYCTACGYHAHPNITCAEKRLTYIPETFVIYKRKNDVRDCTNCGTPIEKDEGCEHVLCGICKLHICWFCMATFTNAQTTYVHIRAWHSLPMRAAGVQYPYAGMFHPHLTPGWTLPRRHFLAPGAHPGLAPPQIQLPNFQQAGPPTTFSQTATRERDGQLLPERPPLPRRPPP